MPGRSTVGRRVVAGIVALYALPCLAVLSVFAYLLAMSGRANESLSADLAFRIDCGSPSAQPDDGAVEAFLLANGFRPVNKVKLARARGEAALLVQDIDGLDEHDRIVAFKRFPVGAYDTWVVLYTPPPTVRADALEATLIEFGGKSGCAAKQVERHTNRGDARPLFNEALARDRRWLRESAAPKPPL